MLDFIFASHELKISFAIYNSFILLLELLEQQVNLLQAQPEPLVPREAQVQPVLQESLVLLVNPLLV